MTPEERMQLYAETFSSDGGDAVIGRARIAYIFDALGRESPTLDFDQVDLREIAWSFESMGLEAARSGSSERYLMAP